MNLHNLILCFVVDPGLAWIVLKDRNPQEPGMDPSLTRERVLAPPGLLLPSLHLPLWLCLEKPGLTIPRTDTYEVCPRHTWACTSLQCHQDSEDTALGKEVQTDPQWGLCFGL